MLGHSLHYECTSKSAIKALWRARIGFERKLASGLRDSPNRFYSYVQSQTKSRNVVTRRLNVEGTGVTCDSEIADGFRRYFSSVYRQDFGSAVPPLETNPAVLMADVQVCSGGPV